MANNNQNHHNMNVNPSSSSSSSQDFALRQLVRSIVGHDTGGSAASLARRVMGSQIGTDGKHHDLTSSDTLHHLWRRIERKSSDRTKCRTDTEQLYQQLEEQVHHNDNLSNDIPPKLLSVLVKLIGHDKYMPAPQQAPAQQQQLQQQQQQPIVQQAPHPTPKPPTTTVSAVKYQGPPPTTTRKNHYPVVYSTPAPTSDRGGGGRGTTTDRKATPAPAATTTTATKVPTTTKTTPAPAPMIPPTPVISSSETIVLDEQRLYDERKELIKEESLLLQECLYSLQGIDGERIRYYHRHPQQQQPEKNSTTQLEKKEDLRYEGIRVQSPSLTYPSALLQTTGRIVPTRLGSGAMDALRICGEAGWLYQRVAQYIQTVQQDDNHHHHHHHIPPLLSSSNSHNSAGVVARAFAGTLAQELRNYHSLLARYESHLSSSSSSRGGGAIHGNGKGGDTLSLRQLLVELRQPTHRLKILALLTDGVGTLSGGHLLTALYRHGEHGDSRHATLVHSILYAASRPWFDILYAWTTQGILSDPHNEFFVVETTTPAGGGGGGGGAPLPPKPNLATDGNFWRNQYTIQKDQIPTGILSKDLVQKALGVGKGINFIRRCLLDGQWTMRLLPPSSSTPTPTTTPGGAGGGILGPSMTDPDIFTNGSSSLGLGSISNGGDNNMMEAGGGGGGGTGVSDPLVGLTDEELKQALGYRYQPPLALDGTPGSSLASSSSSSPLAQTLAQAAELVHTHILRALHDDHHLMDHLWALKQFLLLGQGDFFSVLMDGLHTEFGGGNNSNHNAPGVRGAGGGGGVMGIYKHSVLTIVESALRSSNAKYLPQYVIDRLQVELVLEPDDQSLFLFQGGGGGVDEGKINDNHREDVDDRTVWDIFMLDYQVPDPLLAIVHPTALEQYKWIFSLLFRLKKVEFLLNYTWRQGAILQHALHTSAQYNAINLSSSAGYVQASFLLRNISMTRQSMNHWIVNLKSYLMLEVLEGGWKKLVLAMADAKTLDEVIEAHDRYLEAIVRKSLLRAPTGTTTTAANKNNTPKSSGGGGRPAGVQTLLRLVSDFCDMQERLFQQALLAADVASAKRLEAEKRLRQGRWGYDVEQDKSEVENFFGLADPAILIDFVRLATDFEEHAYDLLQVLGNTVNVGTTRLVLSSNNHPEADNAPNDEGDNDDNDASTCYNKDKAARRFADFAIDDDMDPQRFLIAQLDHNNYYSSQES